MHDISLSLSSSASTGNRGLALAHDRRVRTHASRISSRSRSRCTRAPVPRSISAITSAGSSRTRPRELLQEDKRQRCSAPCSRDRKSPALFSTNPPLSPGPAAPALTECAPRNQHLKPLRPASASRGWPARSSLRPTLRSKASQASVLPRRHGPGMTPTQASPVTAPFTHTLPDASGARRQVPALRCAA